MKSENINLISYGYDKLDEVCARLLNDFKYFSGRKAVYLDYPVHENVGDHLIYWGAMEALKVNGNTILQQYSLHNADFVEINRLVEKHDAVVLLHGGGNFGDLYPKHQKFRLEVIKQLPYAEIIVLPQSVFFSDMQACKAQCRVFAGANVKVHVRDEESFALLAEHGVNVVKTPDCAHALSLSLFKRQRSAVNVNVQLMFRRRDIESITGGSSCFDWDNLITGFDASCFRVVRNLNDTRFASLVLWIYRNNSRRLVNKAIRHYQEYGSVNTDRLHGFLLAVLMSIPVSNSDNSYKKIERYKECWLSEKAG